MSQDPTANLVRRYVDDELTPAERRAFEQRLESEAPLQRQVRFERALRERVASVLRAEAPAAPPELAMRIGAALRDASPLAAAASTKPAPGRGQWLLSRLHDPQHANWLAVAATIMLVLGAVLFGILGRPIDEWGPATESDPGVVEAATWASEEHGRCTYDTAHLREKAALSAADVRRDFTAHVGRPVPPVFDLERYGFKFVGAGHCRVPGPAPSGHLVYRRPDGAMVSLFVVPDLGQLGSGMPPRRWFRIDASACEHEVRCATDGNLLYLLVCCDARVAEPVAGAVLHQIGVAPPPGG